MTLMPPPGVLTACTCQGEPPAWRVCQWFDVEGEPRWVQEACAGGCVAGACAGLPAVPAAAPGAIRWGALAIAGAAALVLLLVVVGGRG